MIVRKYRDEGDARTVDDALPCLFRLDKNGKWLLRTKKPKRWGNAWHVLGHIDEDVARRLARTYQLTGQRPLLPTKGQRTLAAATVRQALGKYDQQMRDHAFTGAYRQTTKRAVEIFEETAPTRVRDIRKEHCEQFVVHLAERKYKPSTIETRWKRVATFLRWCAEKNYLEGEPWRGVKRPKVPDIALERVARAQVVTDRDVAALFPEDETYAAISRALYRTGMRPGELARLRLKDIQTQTMHALIHDRKRKTQRYCPIESLQTLEDLVTVAVYSDQIGWQAYALQLRYESEKRLGFRVTPYAFRHSRITHWITARYGLERVCAWVGTSADMIRKHYYHVLSDQEHARWAE